MGGKRHLVCTSDSKTAAYTTCTVEYTPSVYAIASTRNGLYLDKEAEMACETPLEGDKVRVYTYSKVNSKSHSGQFYGFIVNPLEGWFYQKRSHIRASPDGTVYDPYHEDHLEVIHEIYLQLKPVCPQDFVVP